MEINKVTEWNSPLMPLCWYLLVLIHPPTYSFGFYCWQCIIINFRIKYSFLVLRLSLSRWTESMLIGFSTTLFFVINGVHSLSLSRSFFFNQCLGILMQQELFNTSKQIFLLSLAATLNLAVSCFNTLLHISQAGINIYVKSIFRLRSHQSVNSSSRHQETASHLTSARSFMCTQWGINGCKREREREQEHVNMQIE
jgi:hypothetical protein